MTAKPSPGEQLRQALTQEQPLQLVGAINAYSALLAQQAGFRALYVSGAGVANASLGVPDLGLSTLQDVLTDVRRISGATPLPVLVDADTGWGDAKGVAHTTQEMIRAGAAGMHLEDQVEAKRCGHRPNKALVSVGEMLDRLKAALDARTDETFVIMARTDAYAVESKQAAIDRAGAYIEAGADMLFAEALSQWQDYRDFTQALPAPVLANLTEFGYTPLFTLEQMRQAGVAMVLYPLSAFRAMSQAALAVYQGIRREGTQASLLPRMQTRADLYEALDYPAQEAKLDTLLSNKDAEP